MPLRVTSKRPIHCYAPPDEENWEMIPVPHIEQEQTNWCWAACTNMIRM